MVRYELKKVFGSVGGKIALILYIAVLALSCWLSSTGALNVEVKWVNEQGESEYGPSAVKKLREAQKEWEGWVDQNKLSRVIQENQRINATPEAKSDIVQQNEIAYSWKQGFAPIRKILNESYSNGFREYDYYTADRITAIDEDTFYANREKLLRNWLYDETDGATPSIPNRRSSTSLSSTRNCRLPSTLHTTKVGISFWKTPDIFPRWEF